jgi:membrane protein insertase Oxa1/YidC/SpoIIIJ
LVDINTIEEQTVFESNRPITKWIFPFALTMILVILVILRLNGSSAAIYGIIFNGSNSGDPNLIIGHPRVIRGDEWMVQTPWMISQVLARSTDMNLDIGNGIDFSTVNVPMIDWTLVFRPLFWGFYVLPLENGFSLYWWGKAILLVLASYFLALKLTKEKILVSSFLALGFLFSPFF